MRFRGIDLNLIVCLNALLEEKNVSAAAQRLFVTQSAMSGALARLRRHFNDEILVQLGRRMVLTEFAETMVSPICQLMIDLESIFGSEAQFRPAESQRTFTLAVADHMLQLLMPHVSQRVAMEAPGVILQLVAPAGISAEMIENGTVDLTVTAEAQASRAHPTEFLFAEPYMLIGWRENPSLSKPLTFERFCQLGRAAVRHGPSRSLVAAEAQMLAFPELDKVELVLPSYSSMPNFIIGTQRVGFMHQSLALFFAERYPITVLKPPIEIAPLRIVLQHHQLRARDPGVAWLKGIIRSAVTSNHNWDEYLGMSRNNFIAA